MSAILKKRKVGFDFECKRWKGPVFSKSAISKKKKTVPENKPQCHKNNVFRELKMPKIAHDTKKRFFQSPRYRYPNPTTEKETSN